MVEGDARYLLVPATAGVNSNTSITHMKKISVTDPATLRNLANRYGQEVIGDGGIRG